MGEQGTIRQRCLTEAEVMDFFAGALRGARLAAVEWHLDRCQSCALLVQTAAPLPEETAEPPAPRFGDRYLATGEIGRGGMGTVLEGRDLRIQRELAIKVLLERPGLGGRAAERFVDEAQIQGQLEHPNICPVHDLGVDAQGRPFFTMKKVRGRSLEAILEEQRTSAATGDFSLRRLLEVLVKVCDAVAFAHSRGILHRDIKPANVMIGEFSEVLLMDWGLAKRAHTAGQPGPDARQDVPPSRTLDGSVLGTPSYMPPEQAAG